MPDKKSKVYFGWWITIFGALVSGIIGVLPQQGASVLFKPIATELGLNRAAASVATGINQLQQGPTFFFAGWFSDKFGSKWIAVVGMLIASLGMVLMNYIHSAISYYIVWGIMAFGATLSVSIVIDNAVARWFVRKRGLAISIRFTILGVVGCFGLPLLSWLIEKFSWRITCLVWAGITLICIPVILYFIKQKGPEHYGMMPDGAKGDHSFDASTETILASSQKYAAGSEETDYTFKQAAKTPAFFWINVAWVVHAIVIVGFNLHIIPFLTDRGIDPVVAAGMLAVMIFFSLPSRFFSGLIADRMKKEHIKFIIAGALLCSTIGIVIFLINPSVVTVWVLLIMWGFSMGAYTPVDILMRARYFGRKSYGSIQGFSTLISAPFSFCAPIFTGWIFDRNGSYSVAFMVLAITALIGSVAICLAIPPKAAHLYTSVKAVKTR